MFEFVDVEVYAPFETADDSIPELDASLMERPQSSHQPSRIERQLAHLKILSRLLGHELHAQASPRITLSREEVLEVQTSIDLFIEECMRATKGAGGLSGGSYASAGHELEVQAVPARVN